MMPAYKRVIQTEPEKSPFSNNLTGNAVVFPLQTIPRRNQRRYINHDGGEAVVYYFAGKARIITRASERFGDFQLVPYGSVEDPVVLPLSTGQIFVASKDRLQVRGICPDALCSFSEFLSTPTGDEPLALDQDSSGDGNDASLLFMANGTKWIYTFDLLQRKWNRAFSLPDDQKAISLKRLGAQTMVLDGAGKTLWIHSDDHDGWKQISPPVGSDGPLVQIAISKDKLVLASRRALWVTSIDLALPRAHSSDPNVIQPGIKWAKVIPPGAEQILQISADSSFLYCSTDSGNTFRVQTSELSDPAPLLPWRIFEPSPTLPTEHESILKLRWVDHELLAFSASGVNHSKNLGMSWQREPNALAQATRADEIELSGRVYTLTETAILDASRDEAKRQLWHQIKQLDQGCLTNQAHGEASDFLGSMIPVNAHSLAIVTSGTGSNSQSVCLFDTVTGKLDELSSGWQPSNLPINLVQIDGHLIAGSDRGLMLWDGEKQKWTASGQTLPFDGSSPNGGVTAVAQYGDRGIILATESRAIYYREAWDDGHPWKRIGDKYDGLVNNLQNGNARVNFIWVNPRRLSEIVLLMNQFSNINMYYRDRVDSMFILIPVAGDRATGLVENEAGDLWITGVNNSYYINRNRPTIGSWEDFKQRFEDQAAARLSEPFTWLVGILTSYVVAVLCVLALRFLPVPPVLGRSWLASLVVKPFTISPLLGRWIIFLGYRIKIRKEMLADGPYFGLSALLPDGMTVPPDEEGQNLCEKILHQGATSPCLLVTGRPGAGKSMLLARLAYISALGKSKHDRAFPILVTADDYNGDLIESASEVLRERYGIPMDKADILVGQMQVGGILFLFDGLSEVSISRSAAISDLLQITRMPEFKNCGLIISSRLFDGQPEVPTCQILPVRGEDAITRYLPRFNLPPEERHQVENNLRAFRNEPVDVQLLAMTIESGGQHSFQQRHEIFRAFFQKRLGADGIDGAERWAGWCFALEYLAKWFCLDTGVKSIGLSSRAAIDAMASIVYADGAQGTPRNLLSELRDTYNIDLPNGAALLNYLRTTGLLIRLERWKFAHDTFEEFFCASYLARMAGAENHLPSLALWRSRPEEFIEVFNFLKEFLDLDRKLSIAQQDLPPVWREALLTTQPAGRESN